MKRYIDVDRAISTIEEVWNRKYAKCGYQPLRDCYRMLMKRLKSTPTADVVEVKHGEWIAVPSSDMSTGKAYKCSECDKFRFGCRLPPYCQECGAKMDGKKVTE